MEETDQAAGTRENTETTAAEQAAQAQAPGPNAQAPGPNAQAPGPDAQAAAEAEGEVLESEVLDPETAEGGAGTADETPAESSADAEIAAARAEATERTNDLKRLQAEYVNYKRRVDRDRDVAREGGIEKVLVDLFSVLDDLRAAKQHEELTGGFKLVAEEIDKVTRRYGLESYGEKDDPFDPQIHEALMQVPTPGIEEPVCLDVMQVGYRRGDRVLRAARVAVAMPTDEPAAGGTGTEESAPGQPGPAGDATED